MPERGQSVRALAPAPGEVAQIGQRHGQASLAQHRGDPLARPEHRRRSAIGALERGAFVAGCFPKVLLVGLQVIEGIGRREFLVLHRDRARQSRSAIERPPLGKSDIPSVQFTSFELVLIRRRPAAVGSEITRMLGAAAFFDRHQCEVKIAARLSRRRDQHAGHSGVRALQRRKPKLRRRVSMLQRIDQFLRRVVLRRALAGGAMPATACRCGPVGRHSSAVRAIGPARDAVDCRRGSTGIRR